MRVVTRADFDGVVWAVLLYEAEKITEPVKWVEPNEMQKGMVDVRNGDIIANLPYNEKCSLWFDHHYSNQISRHFRGAFNIAPSAARVVFDYYPNVFKRDYSELITETDKIDSADLSLDEVLHPEKYSYVLLSMTISGFDKTGEPYWNRLVALLREHDIKIVLEDPEVKKRCEETVKRNIIYNNLLKEHTRLKEHVSVTDFRHFDKAPSGNRFMVYSLFPESVVNVKIRYDNDDRQTLVVSVGHSIFNRKCNVNVGQMLSNFEGGGHRGAGACSFHVSKTDDYLPKIIDILLKNE